MPDPLIEAVAHIDSARELANPTEREIEFYDLLFDELVRWESPDYLDSCGRLTDLTDINEESRNDLQRKYGTSLGCAIN